MTHWMSDQVLRGRRRQGGRSTRLLLGAVAAAFAANACLSDVNVPDCIEDRSCVQGGEAGEAGEAGSNASSGSGPRAGSPTTAGEAAVVGGQGGGGNAGGTDDQLEVGGEGGMPASTCKDCEIRPLDLPAPCAGGPYSARLSVQGGTGPYGWRLTPAVEGWEINVDPKNPDDALLTSPAAASADTTLTVEVTDATGARKSQKYTVHAREACWFAYTSLGSQGPQLHLLDPLVIPAAPATLEHETGVYDFQFSPDGAYLAYRFGVDVDHPHGQHLALVELATLKERLVPFGEEVVTGFAWSPDGSVLAASFEVGGVTKLGAARMPAPGSGDSPTSLSPIVAYVESDLYWIGNDFVAYHAEKEADENNPGEFTDNPEKLRTAFVAELGATGFSDQVITEGASGPGVVLRPTDEGLFMISNNPFTRFTKVVGGVSDTAAWHLFISLIAPSGKYTAQLDSDNLLQVLSAETGIFSAPVASAKAGETCPTPLAWAKGAERIACVADVPNQGGATSHGEVRFFDLAGDTLEMSTLGGFCAEDVTALPAASCGQMLKGYAYGTQQATGQARAFSPSGRWFAFTRSEQSDKYLYWADLNAKPPALTGARFYQDGGDPTRLLFSPNERFVLFQQGTLLHVQELASGDTHGLNTHQALGEKCSEDFPMAPDGYCGDTERAATLRWSPDSTLVAYRASGALTVADISHFPADLSFPLPAPDCGDACAAQFAFQPQLHH